MRQRRNMPRSIAELKDMPLPGASVAIPGFAASTDSIFTPLPADGVLFVPMNAAYHTTIPRGKMGQVYTTGLAGCTGVAGVARTPEGTLAGVSHFDPVVELAYRRDGIAPSEQFIRQFVRIARHLGSESIRFAVAYSAELTGDPHYGERLGDFGDWHFLDQLESNVEEPEDDVHLELAPYALDAEARRTWARGTLAATVRADAALSIDFDFSA